MYQKKGSEDEIELAYQSKLGDTKLPAIKPNAVNNENFNMLERMDENILRNTLGGAADDVIAPINVRRRN
jgi:hypothetical protein